MARTCSAVGYFGWGAGVKGPNRMPASIPIGIGRPARAGRQLADRKCKAQLWEEAVEIGSNRPRSVRRVACATRRPPAHPANFRATRLALWPPKPNELFT